jgi:hypothetical protein
MKKFLIFMFALSISSILTLSSDINGKAKGDSCFDDLECGFNLTCNDGVCIRKKELDFGSSGKTGNPCNIDADCINSGKCAVNNFGKKYCTGN